MWEDFTARSPRDQIVSGAQPTMAQKELGLKKTAAANEKREQRVAAMFDAGRAEAVVKQYGYSQAIYDLLYESRGNLDVLLAFLEDSRYGAGEKEKLLLTLSAKDRRDVDPDVLREALELSKPYYDGNDALFYPYIACPRVFNEPLRKNRQFILDYLSEEQKAAFRANPAQVWDYVQKEIGFDPTIEYGQIVTRPVGALTVRNASPLSRKILFVSICRALGIAARMNLVDQQAEYYADGGFVPVEVPQKGDAAIIFEKGSGESWQYDADFAIGMLVDGMYQTLDLSKEQWEGDTLRIEASSGMYRIITDNRLPNGDLHASKYHFRLNPGEAKAIRLHKFQADLSEMLDNFTLEEFKVCDSEGREVLGSELTGSKAVLMWLEEGKEPTEHILNEMLEQEADFQNLPAEILFMVRSREALENAKLQKVLQTFPKIRVYYDTFVPNVETLARRMYVDPEKLPLILVTTRTLNAVYACSGYNVGSGDMIVKVCQSV